MTYLDPDLMILSHHYLVLIPEIVVAQDISQTIAVFDPASKVIVAASIREAEQALTGFDSVEIAFIAGCPVRFEGSALHRKLVASGARIVLLGYDAEVTGPTHAFDVLPQPFDTAAVIAKLQTGHAHCR